MGHQPSEHENKLHGQNACAAVYAWVAVPRWATMTSTAAAVLQAQRSHQLTRDFGSGGTAVSAVMFCLA